MFRIICVLVVLLASFLGTSCSQFGGQHPAVTEPVPVENLANYANYPANVKKVISKALVLSRKNLTYHFGSANPRTGGMDCSGVFYYLLRHMKHHTYVPRDSYEMYMWLLRAGKIHHVTYENFHSAQFNALKPGDLLFWTNTFRTNRRPPITHVMMYLGKDKNNQPLMFGSSDGGIYKDRVMWGVSVFDFILPLPRDRDRFVAYGCIPGFTC